MTELLRVSTSDGKYTVIQEAGTGLRFLRHGEPWPAAIHLRHSNLILALAQDLEEARAEIERLKTLVEKIPEGVYYAPDADNFYNSHTHQGCGTPFYDKWYPRRQEFPTTSRWSPERRA